LPQIKGLFVTARGGTAEVKEAWDAFDGDLIVLEDADEGQIIEAVKDVDVAMTFGAGGTRAIFEAMDRCQGWVSFGHGFDGADLDAAVENGVILANTASFGTDEVSNQAMMHLLVCSRKFVLHDKLVKSGVWTREHLPPMGHLPHQILGIIGTGNIGRAVGRKAKAFGMRVVAYDPYISSWDTKEIGFEAASSVNEVCAQADYLTLHTMLNEDTFQMIGDTQFKIMKPTAYLINVSRGKCVDEAALIRALNDGEIAGAGLDTFEQEPTPADNPLLKMDNVSVTSHYASYSEVAFTRGLTQLGEEGVRIALGQWPMSLINPAIQATIPPRDPAQAWGTF
jgi:D-3-phosphoglycerate dehydrogenase